MLLQKNRKKSLETEHGSSLDNFMQFNNFRQKRKICFETYNGRLITKNKKIKNKNFSTKHLHR